MTKAFSTTDYSINSHFDLLSKLPLNIKNKTVLKLSPNQVLLCAQVSKLWNTLLFDNCKAINAKRACIHLDDPILQSDIRKAYFKDRRIDFNIYYSNYKFDEFVSLRNIADRFSMPSQMCCWKNNAFLCLSGWKSFLIYENKSIRPIFDDKFITCMSVLNTKFNERLLIGTMEGEIYEIFEDKSPKLIVSELESIRRILLFQGNFVVLHNYDSFFEYDMISIINFHGKILNSAKGDVSDLHIYKESILVIDWDTLIFLDSNLKLTDTCTAHGRISKTQVLNNKIIVATDNSAYFTDDTRQWTYLNEHLTCPIEFIALNNQLLCFDGKTNTGENLRLCEFN
ncbi:MAG: hypothetical protein JHC93_05600, partial [Parachlamydiales bacterium]|nr:hypothetical protein [Parachlamydiales bacterium]